MEKVQILAADYLVTMDANNTVVKNGAVLIKGNRIGAVGTRDELTAQYSDVPVRYFENRVMMPGLVNTHCHSGLLRGTAENLPVWDWLRLHIDPMHRVLEPEDAEASSWNCYAEALLSGTTTIVDMWRYMDGSARASEGLGIRSVLVPYVADHPDFDYFESIDDNEALIQNWHGAANDRIHVWAGMEHAWYCTEDKFRKIIDLTLKYDTGLHTHSNEAEIEIKEMHERYGKRSVHVLNDFGFFEPKNVLLAHCVWLDDGEIQVLAEKGVGVTHNPVSNMKLASGIARVEAMLNAGVNVGIGTDGEKENNNLDLFEEMKCTSLLGKLKDLNAAALNAWEVLQMGTRMGAAAIGLDKEIGSLEVGKKADIIAVRSDTPRMTPLIGEGEFFNLHYNLVHAVHGGDVDMTMVDGNIVVDGGHLQTADLQELIAKVNHQVPALFARRKKFLAEHPEGGASPFGNY